MGQTIFKNKARVIVQNFQVVYRSVFQGPAWYQPYDFATLDGDAVRRGLALDRVEYGANGSGLEIGQVH